MSRFIQIDCHLKDKPEVVEMRMLLGLDDNAASNATILGPLVLLWSYAQIHAEKDGKIKMRWEFMPQMFGGTGELWDACKEVGWLTYENGYICVSKWEETFYSKTNAGRSKKYRDEQKQTKRALASARECSEYTTEQNEQNAAPRIEEIRKEKITQEEKRREEPAPAGDLSSVLFEFKKNLQAAGVAVGSLPPQVMDALNNGEAATYLKASRELSHTGLMDRPSPPHVGNFKKLDWVQRLANGEFSKGGPAPVDKESQRPFFPPAGKYMWPEEAKAWVNESEGNRHAYEVWQQRSQKNADRDSHRGDTPSADAPIPQAIPRAVLKNADEDFDTEAAKEKALAALAAHLEK